MARANRHFIPGYTWHLTHRCHKKEFLLKFSRDRSRWMELLFEAKKRFQLSILNFVVTSNHIHLIVSDNRGNHSIPRAMQLLAGRTGQSYNRRKDRKGAFWEDRYHATAIESGDHLWRCLVYVDLNMVRAGVVDHPCEWKWGGYNEIQKPKARYRLIDHGSLQCLLNVATTEELIETHRRWVDSLLKEKRSRLEHFSKSLAVGSETFLKKVKVELLGRGTGRSVIEVNDSEYQLKESLAEYRREGVSNSDPETHRLPDTNEIPWNQCKSLNAYF
jgi:REP element-mobilizing transposase RayT